jgi:hypothetical protein
MDARVSCSPIQRSSSLALCSLVRAADVGARRSPRFARAVGSGCRFVLRSAASVGLHVVDHPPCDLPDCSSRALLPEAGTRRGRLARTVSAVSPGNGTGRDAVGSRCSDPEGSSPGTGRCLVPQVGPVRALVATWLAGARRSLTVGRGRARGRGCGETPPHSACRGARRAPWRPVAASARRGPAGLRTGCGAHGARRACARASS